MANQNGISVASRGIRGRLRLPPDPLDVRRPYLCRSYSGPTLLASNLALVAVWRRTGLFCQGLRFSNLLHSLDHPGREVGMFAAPTIAMTIVVARRPPAFAIHVHAPAKVASLERRAEEKGACPTSGKFHREFLRGSLLERDFPLSKSRFSVTSPLAVPTERRNEYRTRHGNDSRSLGRWQPSAI